MDLITEGKKQRQGTYYQYKMSIIEKLKNKNHTTIFLLYAFIFNEKLFEEHNFVQAYIHDNNIEEIHDYCLYLRFKPNFESENYILFEAEMLRSGLIIDMYLLNEEEIVFIAQLKKEFHEDMDKFLNGEYSKFSTKFKNRMCSPQDALIRGIVDKEEYARISMSNFFDIDIPKNQEYYSKPNIKKEILNYE